MNFCWFCTWECDPCSIQNSWGCCEGIGSTNKDNRTSRRVKSSAMNSIRIQIYLTACGRDGTVVIERYGNSESRWRGRSIYPNETVIVERRCSGISIELIGCTDSVDGSSSLVNEDRLVGRSEKLKSRRVDHDITIILENHVDQIKGVGALNVCYAAGWKWQNSHCSIQTLYVAGKSSTPSKRIRHGEGCWKNGWAVKVNVSTIMLQVSNWTACWEIDLSYCFFKKKVS